jgi:hypothetical protein
MNRPILFVMLCVIIVSAARVAHADDLKVMLLDSKTGQALHGKIVCISFHPDPRGSEYDKTETCGTTDRSGVLRIIVSHRALELVQVGLGTNDLLPCFGQQIPVADIFSTGVIARNTCGDASHKVAPEVGSLILFAHQMNFGEVLKSMGHELF